VRGDYDSVRINGQRFWENSERDLQAPEFESPEGKGGMKPDTRIVVVLRAGISEDMDIIFPRIREGLSDFLKHTGVIHRLQHRSDDYLPFFYYLRQKSG
jgi:hypothetical protein